MLEYLIGSAYIFYSADSNSAWTQVSHIFSNDGFTKDYFGSSISVFQNVVAVGAHWDDTARGADTGKMIDVHHNYIILNILFYSLFEFILLKDLYMYSTPWME